MYPSAQSLSPPCAVPTTDSPATHFQSLKIETRLSNLFRINLPESCITLLPNVYYGCRKQFGTATQTSMFYNFTIDTVQSHAEDCCSAHYLRIQYIRKHVLKVTPLLRVSPSYALSSPFRESIFLM